MVYLQEMNCMIFRYLEVKSAIGKLGFERVRDLVCLRRIAELDFDGPHHLLWLSDALCLSVRGKNTSLSHAYVDVYIKLS